MNAIFPALLTITCAIAAAGCSSASETTAAVPDTDPAADPTPAPTATVIAVGPCNLGKVVANRPLGDGESYVVKGGACPTLGFYTSWILSQDSNASVWTPDVSGTDVCDGCPHP